MTPAFRHGVASGDPVTDRVVLWTRVSGLTGDAAVAWRVARDEALTEVVADGTATASGSHDWTVTVDAGGLPPATRLWFGFECDGVRSPTGRTRTAPAAGLAPLRLGLVSCASWPAGWFTAYGHLAEREVDLVVGVGDYIYEGDPAAAPAVRFHEPAGVVHTLAGYRARFAQYRTDPDLQRLHARHPMVAVWDDHEFASEACRSGARDHDPAVHGAWTERLLAAAKAYREWMPLRWPDPTDALRVYRRLRWGDLADLLLIDSRIVGREQPPDGGGEPVIGVAQRDLSLLGAEQRAWLHGCLRSSTARWRVIGNQVMLAPLRVVELPRLLAAVGRPLGALAGGLVVNPGQWDGYPHERAALFDLLQREGIDNVVVLTGDLHSSWACELTLQPRGDGPRVGVEFVTPSVTSDSFSQLLVGDLPGAVRATEALLRRENGHVRWVDTRSHGYVVVDVTPARVQADFWHVERADRIGAAEHWAAGWVVRDGETRLQRADAPVT